jgi:CRP-like cAMP-binding protein
MEQFIKTVNSLCALPGHEQEMVRNAVTRKKINKNDFFVTEGKPASQLAFIEAGVMRKFQVTEEGEEITSEFIGPGVFCGAYYSFYMQQPSFEYIQALTDCDILTLSYHDLQQLYKTSFHFNVFGRRFIEQSCIQKEFRARKIISLPARERYEWFVDEFPEINKVAQVQHIASYLGMNPETLSRIRRKLIS